MKPKHQDGYMIIKKFHKASTIDLVWVMSLPKCKREKFLNGWEVVAVCLR